MYHILFRFIGSDYNAIKGRKCACVWEVAPVLGTDRKSGWIRLRPDFRLQNPAPVPAPAGKKFAGFLPDFSFFYRKKNQKKILANNKHGGLNRGKKWFSEKLRKNFDLENFRSELFSRRTSCIGGSRFRARVAEGRPASRDHITGGNLESKIL